jgi:hypothetical protein
MVPEKLDNTRHTHIMLLASWGIEALSSTTDARLNLLTDSRYAAANKCARIRSCMGLQHWHDNLVFLERDSQP